MLTVNRLREFVAEAVVELEALKSGKVVVTKDDIVKFMNDHNESDNMLLIGIVPEHDVSGNEDALLVENDFGFYILAKTDYSEYDHDAFLDIFADTQQAAFDLVNLITEKNTERGSSFCGLFQRLADVAFPITPIKGLNSCNGYFIGVNVETDF